MQQTSDRNGTAAVEKRKGSKARRGSNKKKAGETYQTQSPGYQTQVQPGQSQSQSQFRKRREVPVTTVPILMINSDFSAKQDDMSSSNNSVCMRYKQIFIALGIQMDPKSTSGFDSALLSACQSIQNLVNVVSNSLMQALIIPGQHTRPAVISGQSDPNTTTM